MELRQSLLAIARETKDPSQLVDAIVAAAAKGAGQEFVLGELTAVREQLTLPDEEVADDAVLDAMDCVVGWCGPHARIRFDNP
jgi:hypothetical protein